MFKGISCEFENISDNALNPRDKTLNPKQQENFNFQKVASTLADYGFNCIRLSDDWQGADFIACHIDGNTFLKIQLKGRLMFQKKYNGKNIYIAFRQDEKCYIYPHDELQMKFLRRGLMKGTKAWEVGGAFGWPRIPKHLERLMAQYAI